MAERRMDAVTGIGRIRMDSVLYNTPPRAACTGRQQLVVIPSTQISPWWASHRACARGGLPGWGQTDRLNLKSEPYFFIFYFWFLIFLFFYFLLLFLFFIFYFYFLFFSYFSFFIFQFPYIPHSVAQENYWILHYWKFNFCPPKNTPFLGKTANLRPLSLFFRGARARAIFSKVLTRMSEAFYTIGKSIFCLPKNTSFFG